MVPKMAGVHADTFVYQPPTPEQLEVLKKWRDHCLQMQYDISKVLPDSAELTLAMRKLEEFNMWLNKAIVLHGTIQAPIERVEVPGFGVVTETPIGEQR